MMVKWVIRIEARNSCIHTHIHTRKYNMEIDGNWWKSMEIDGNQSGCSSMFTGLTQTQCLWVCSGQGTWYHLTSSRVTTGQNCVTFQTIRNVSANELEGLYRAVFPVVFHWIVAESTFYMEVFTMIFRVKPSKAESDECYPNTRHIWYV